MDVGDAIDVNPPSLSQQAVADSDSSEMSDESTPPTPSLPPPIREETPVARECIMPRAHSHIKPGAVKQRLLPHGGKRVFYQCEKCQNLSLNRLAYNNHVATCHGRNTAPKEAEVIDVRAIRFEKSPTLGTCPHCLDYTQQQGPLLDCHQYICGHRQWRGEIGDPPYIPPFKFWIIGEGFRKPPPDFDQVLSKFARGGIWEVEEQIYLHKKNLSYLLPNAETTRVSLPVQQQNLDSVMTKGAPVDLSNVTYGNDRVAIVEPVRSRIRRRYKERRHPNPLYSTLIGSVYDVKLKTVVGHLMIVGEPRFGLITLTPFRSNRDRLVVFHKVPAYSKDPPFNKPVAASVALHNVQTGKVTSIIESDVSPRHWEPEYHIFTDPALTQSRSPSIEVTYTEIPSELLKLFSAELLSPSSAGMRK